jgi:phytoene dehydrogenase-like protein
MYVQFQGVPDAVNGRCMAPTASQPQQHSIEETAIMPKDRDYDVVVIGAGVGGLTSGAILGHRGYRVAVVDVLDRLGGRMGAAPYRGHWINFSARDAESGIGDGAQPSRQRKKAEALAGIELPERIGAFGDAVRVHTLPEETVSTVRMADITASTGSEDELGMYRWLVESFGPKSTPDEVTAAATELRSVYESLGSLPSRDAWALVPIRVGDWLPSNVMNKLTRAVILNQLEASHASPAMEASIGRFALSFHWVYGAEDWVIDPDVGNMQTMINPWGKAIEANGGELWLGWKPVEIMVEDRETGFGSGLRAKVTGVVALDKHNIVQVLRAPVVVADYMGWDLPRLLDRALLPETFIEAAEATRRQAGEMIAWVASLTRLPTIRATGKEETFPGWQRIAHGDGPMKNYHGGWHFPSLADPGSAPEGRHQIHILDGHHGPTFRRFADSKAVMDRSLAYLRSYYSDLDECIEWSEYQVDRAPQIITWHLKPGFRHPVKVSTIAGLYVASSSAEGMAGWVDLESEKGIEAAELVTAEYPLQSSA